MQLHKREPRHSVSAVLTSASQSALQLKKNGAPSAASVIEPIHTDFFGDQRTVPSTGLAPCAATIRSEPGTRRIALAQPVPELRALRSRALSFFSGRDTGHSSETNPFSVLTRLSRTSE